MIFDHYLSYFVLVFFVFFLLLGSEQLGLRRQQKQHKLNIALLFGVTASQRYFTQQINYNFFYLCNIFSIFVDWTPIIQKNKKISHIPKKFSEIFDYTQKIFWNIQILQPHLKLKFFFFYALIIKVVHLPLLQKKTKHQQYVSEVIAAPNFFAVLKIFLLTPTPHNY